MSSDATACAVFTPALEVFEEIWRRHGHRCPMSTLGGRLGHAARRRLDGAAGADLRAVYAIATCAVDGIAVTTGCSEEAGTLTVNDCGRHHLVLHDLVSGSAVSAEIRPEALALAGVYRNLDTALERDRGALTAAELARRLEEKDRVLAELLPKLRALPEDELMLVRPLNGSVAWAEGVDR